jgi:hypothetical protein
MAYLKNMPATCRARATRPEYALDLLDSLTREFQKGMNGGIFDPSYVLSKLATLTDHVKWLEVEATREFARDEGASEDE